MKNTLPIIRALLAQSTLNSQIILMMGVLAIRIDPTSEDAELLSMLQTTIDKSSEFVASIEAAVSKLEAEHNG